MNEFALLLLTALQCCSLVALSRQDTPNALLLPLVLAQPCRPFLAEGSLTLARCSLVYTCADPDVRCDARYAHGVHSCVTSLDGFRDGGEAALEVSAVAAVLESQLGATLQRLRELKDLLHLRKKRHACACQ